MLLHGCSYLFPCSVLQWPSSRSPPIFVDIKAVIILTAENHRLFLVGWRIWSTLAHQSNWGGQKVLNKLGLQSNYSWKDCSPATILCTSIMASNTPTAIHFWFYALIWKMEMLNMWCVVDMTCPFVWRGKVLSGESFKHWQKLITHVWKCQKHLATTAYFNNLSDAVTKIWSLKGCNMLLECNLTSRIQGSLLSY